MASERADHTGKVEECPLQAGIVKMGWVKKEKKSSMQTTMYVDEDSCILQKSFTHHSLQFK